MRRLFFAAALLPLATPAVAKDRAYDTEAELGHMARAMGDPARQEAMARAIGTMTEVLLDIPLAPIIRPMAEAAGQDPRDVDPDTTLRSMSPGAGEVSRQIERELPRAMGAMAGMSGALASTLPALGEATERMRAALPYDLP